jgi:primosomal protein N' (replication factor Y)
MSEYYYTPLYRVAWGMFPPGISWRTETVVHLEQAGGEAAPSRAEERLILGALSRDGPVPLAQLKRQLKSKHVKALLERMERKGWVRRQVTVQGPRVKPKTETVVRLHDLPTEDALKILSTAPRQREILQYLQQRAQEPDVVLPLVVPLAELQSEVRPTRQMLVRLAERGFLSLDQREVRRDPLAGREFVTTVPPKFTADQENAWEPIAAALDVTETQVFLLHGVTGSGKTEIYLRALAKVLDQGGQGIVLVPEIALTPQTIHRFAARFEDRLAVLHSGLSAGERYDEWRRIRRGKADVVIGPRSALFAPLPRLRLVVLDEEHEWTYKQQEMPRYQARDVAVKLAELTGAVVVLGSATPDLTSYYRARRGEYKLLHLPKRIMGHQRHIEEQRERFHLGDRPDRTQTLGSEYEVARYMDLPPVRVVDLRSELRAGNTSIFSRALQRALAETLAAGEQAILFLNRRGAATFVLCRDCGFVMKCPLCDVPLTYHSDRSDLLCHHCSYVRAMPQRCPECASKRIKFFGIGTQTVERVVREQFPEARVLRWDRDVTGTKGAHEAILSQLVHGQADVLVGTQMLAKGLDLPWVTLVGVVTADTALHLPDFRASERTFQLLTQVAGRAGRSILGGKVIIQTYAPQHFCIQAASRHDYEGFYQQELSFRREQGYPPFSRLVRLLFAHASASRCEEESEKLQRLLTDQVRRLGLPDVSVIGPAPCFFARVRGRYRWQLVLRGANPLRLLERVSLGLGWQVDVDPVSLL